MTDLAEFLLARIAEDEAAAYEATILDGAYGSEYRVSYNWLREVRNTETRESSFTNVMQVRAPSPARVLAECDAKRRIVAAHQPLHQGGYTDCATCREPYEGEADPWPCGTLRALALPYADNPDYREEWRP